MKCCACTLPSPESFRRKPTYTPLLALSLLIQAAPAPAAAPAAPAPAAEAAAAPAPCPNPYFPLEDGLRLTYRAGKSEVLILTRDVHPTPDGAGLKGTVEVDIKDRKGSTEATCGAEGVSTGLGGLEGVLLSASGLDVQVTAAEGVAVPPPARMVPGGSWKNSLSIKMRPPERANLGGMRPVISTTFDKESTVEGTEQVTVEGGTFQALKVKNRTTARSGNRPGADPGRSIESTLWFAPGVGLVKIQTGTSVDLELVRVERPVAAAQADGGTAKKAKKKRAVAQ
nr:MULTISPECIES: hypothetical protein [Myxococcaceae]